MDSNPFAGIVKIGNSYTAAGKKMMRFAVFFTWSATLDSIVVTPP